LQMALVVIYVIICLSLIATVLLQSGKSAGLSGSISGGGQALFGKKKGLDDLFGKISTGLAVAFMLTAIILNLF
jgi:preprotein translocase subunit SecG